MTDPTMPPQGDPYGQNPGQNPYAQNPYGGAPAPAYAGPAPSYAHWGKRVLGYVIDNILGAFAAFPVWIGYGMVLASVESTTTTDPTTGMTQTTVTDADFSALSLSLILLGLAMAVGFFIWNLCIRQGRTGYSLGKSVMGIKLIKEQTGQPVGAGMSFVRQIAHILNSLPCDVGWLWPLWDAKNQTFSDKVMGTIVVNQPKD